MNSAELNALQEKAKRALITRHRNNIVGALDQLVYDASRGERDAYDQVDALRGEVARLKAENEDLRVRLAVKASGAVVVAQGDMFSAPPANVPPPPPVPPSLCAKCTEVHAPGPCPAQQRTENA